jgi:ferredoxin--NADP+ reductase
MSEPKLGSPERPLRVAVVGSGPAGFYATDALLRAKDLTVEVDLFDRLPTPFGLVRYGVAPDHQNIKAAIRAFEKTAKLPRFRFLGNVDVCHAVGADELARHYDQIVWAVGCETDRRLGIPGEDLPGSHPATLFVAWYNGHPDHRHHRFDLTTERAVIVGVGDVSTDITRILVRRRDELEKTDVADYAMRALRESRVREVVWLGRRGPGEAAFAQKELATIAELDDVDVLFDPAQIEQALARADELETAARKKVEYMAELSRRGGRGARHIVRLRFLTSPVELIGDGRVQALKVEKNALVTAPDGSISARGTGEHELIETGLVFRSVGYHGVPLPGVPWDGKKGRISNVDGRVTDAAGAVVPDAYVVGWIKRGPTGLIGTNKGDAVATVKKMLEDVAGRTAPIDPQKCAQAVDRLLAAKGVRPVSWDDWEKLDRAELELGARRGKVREKLTSVEQMLAVLAGARPD